MVRRVRYIPKCRRLPPGAGTSRPAGGGDTHGATVGNAPWSGRFPKALSTRHSGRQQERHNSPERDSRTRPVRIVPLGGLGEIGKNMMAIEYGEDIVIVDAGLMFPDEEMLGVDLVIPDTTYLADKLDRIRGIFITHGHEDHVGALPYVLPQLGFPTVYATKLTNGLITVKLREHRLLDRTNMVVVDPSETVRAGKLTVIFLRVNHSIPDAVAVVVRTPAGIVAP